MKSLMILVASLIAIPAHAGRIICENKAANPYNGENTELEVVETLEIVGVLDAEGLLDVRKDQDTMATLVSKRIHGLNLCKGVNIDPNQDPQGKKQGWKEAKLNSNAFRIRLVRDQVTGNVQARAATPESAVNFQNCVYEKSEGDDEAVQAIFEELKAIDEDPETIKWREEIKAKDEVQFKESNENAATAAAAAR